MTTAAICYVRHDAHFAVQAAEYLNLNTSLTCEPAVCETPAEFLDLIEQCLSHKFVLVILSPASVPAPWPRQLWEPVLIDGLREADTRVAWVQLASCALPPLLKRKNFFELSQSLHDGLRLLRQWLIHNSRSMNPAPGITPPGEQKNAPLHLLHKPGIALNVSSEETAWMIGHCRRDFDAIYQVSCAHRSRPGILGDLAEQMNLRLTGTLPQNWRGITQEAARQRSLYVFQHLPDEFRSLTELGGKASVIVQCGTEPPCVNFAQLRELFFAAQPDEAGCIRALDAFCSSEGRIESWTDAYTIATRGLRILLQQGRNAEAHELTKWMAAGAKRASDMAALDRIRWEEIWILDAWDLTPYERAAFTQTQPAQLALPLF